MKLPLEWFAALIALLLVIAAATCFPNLSTHHFTEASSPDARGQ